MIMAHGGGSPRPDFAPAGAMVVDVCICTFRRASVVETLSSLAAQILPAGTVLRVIVADNDDTPSARPAVMAAARELGLDLTYVHCPARNISVARNAGLDAATARFVAFIDDDEIAGPTWLAELLATARSGAAAVLGPVHATYRPDAPAWMVRGDFHSTLPVDAGGAIRTGYTCNVLLDRAAPSLIGKRFALELGRSGGEDTEFFDRVFRDGGHIVFAPAAIVTEPVPAERAAFGWLARRRYRMGQTHGAILAACARSPWRRGAAIGIAGGKIAVSLAGALVTLPSAERSRRWLLRATMHAGVVARLAGRRREIVQYGIVPAEDASGRR